MRACSTVFAIVGAALLIGACGIRAHHLGSASVPRLAAPKNTNGAAARTATAPSPAAVEPSDRPTATSDSVQAGGDRPQATAGEGQPATPIGTSGRWTVTTITRTPTTMPAESSASTAQGHPASTSAASARRVRWYLLLPIAALVIVLAIRALSRRGVAG